MKFEKSIQKGLSELRKDNKSGANQLINKSIEILKLQLDLIKDPHQDIKDLVLDLSKERHTAIAFTLHIGKCKLTP